VALSDGEIDSRVSTPPPEPDVDIGMYAYELLSRMRRYSHY
jgi:hypothetical protein